MTIKTIAFVVNIRKPESEPIALKLLEIAAEKKINCKLLTQYPILKDSLKGVDVCCTIGGDGTLLSCIEEAILANVPIFGINVGKLGFLASVAIEDAKHVFCRLLEGQFKKVKRQLLRCTSQQGKVVYALNDVVIKQESYSHLIHLRVSTQKESVIEYHADGLIFSTPTGSTAYNLSANGPILHPNLKGYVMTPICPHSLINRPLVFDSHMHLTVEVCSPSLPEVMVDGRPFEKGINPTPLTLEMSDESITLIEPDDYSYFKVLREKLHWTTASP
ncbi:MAG: hypothetical protein A2Y14_02240 [Verrucomicrobia bacterium GWF2_51_19]|nr:MAG: hypothetical protein A2Y14_02240 [Verrucomicrobia bacterium GWF2_51_19]HCJ12213.1 NAD(+) kinase [Opitutae bacterium]